MIFIISTSNSETVREKIDIFDYKKIKNHDIK